MNSRMIENGVRSEQKIKLSQKLPLVERHVTNKQGYGGGIVKRLKTPHRNAESLASKLHSLCYRRRRPNSEKKRRVVWTER